MFTNVFLDEGLDGQVNVLSGRIGPVYVYALLKVKDRAQARLCKISFGSAKQWVFVIPEIKLPGKWLVLDDEWFACYVAGMTFSIRGVRVSCVFDNPVLEKKRLHLGDVLFMLKQYAAMGARKRDLIREAVKLLFEKGYLASELQYVIPIPSYDNFDDYDDL